MTASGCAHLYFWTAFSVISPSAAHSQSSPYREVSGGILNVSYLLGSPWDFDSREWKTAIVGQFLNISEAMSGTGSQEDSTYLGYASSLMNQWRLASLSESAPALSVSNALLEIEMRAVWLAIQGTREQKNRYVGYFLDVATQLLLSELEMWDRSPAPTTGRDLESLPLTLFEKNSTVLVIQNQLDQRLSNWLNETGWFRSVHIGMVKDTQYDTIVGLSGFDEFCGSVITRMMTNSTSRRLNNQKSALIGHGFAYLNPC